MTRRIWSPVGINEGMCFEDPKSGTEEQQVGTRLELVRGPSGVGGLWLRTAAPAGSAALFLPRPRRPGLGAACPTALGSQRHAGLCVVAETFDKEPGDTTNLQTFVTKNLHRSSFQSRPLPAYGPRRSH